MTELTPETLRALVGEEYDSLTHRQHVLAHSSAWDKDMDGWGRALNDIVHLKARIEALEREVQELRARLAELNDASV